MDAKVFEQVNAELVRVRAAEDARLFALYFDEKSGNLEEVHLEAGIHALAKQCGAEVTVRPFAGYENYQCFVGNVRYVQAIPKQSDEDAE